MTRSLKRLNLTPSKPTASQVRNAITMKHAKFTTAPTPPGGTGWFGQIDRAWANGWYAVLGRMVSTETTFGEVLHLAVRDLPNNKLGWAELQWVKDQIAGPDRLAIEVYPPAAAVVDQANMYHLWVLPVGFTLPFGIGREESK